MDTIDKTILNRIQSDFPIVSRPYAAIAEEIGISESDVMNRVRHLKTLGVIRRIGGNIVPGKLGFVSTLCAAKVPADQIDHFAKVVNGYPGVTHNYVRNHPYNVWFTFIAPSRKIIEQALSDISEKTGVKNILNLPATKVFKIKAQFEV